jgi:hypothetical protein
VGFVYISNYAEMEEDYIVQLQLNATVLPFFDTVRTNVLGVVVLVVT